MKNWRSVPTFLSQIPIKAAKITHKTLRQHYVSVLHGVPIYLIAFADTKCLLTDAMGCEKLAQGFYTVVL